MERTFVMLKPDSLQRNFVGKIISRFEEKGLKLVAMKMLQLDDKLVEGHYGQYKERSFYARMKDYVTAYPVVAMVWEGRDAVKIVRLLVGATNSAEAAPGTIRGDFAMGISCNLIHASDSVEVAKAEYARFFKDSEILGWAPLAEKMIYSD